MTNLIGEHEHDCTLCAVRPCRKQCRCFTNNYSPKSTLSRTLGTKILTEPPAMSSIGGLVAGVDAQLRELVPGTPRYSHTLSTPAKSSGPSSVCTSVPVMTLWET